MKWDRARYETDAVTAARNLIGAVLVRETEEGRMACRITETEAYGGTFEGRPDDGCHAFRGRTKRTEVMFRAGGCAYVYLIYGMYHCLNLVTGPEGEAQAVLIRAAEPLEGIEWMQKRRNRKTGPLLTAGPGRLCMAMGITKKQNGADLVSDSLYVEDGEDLSPQIDVSTRIHVQYAEYGKYFPWRFTLHGSLWISK